MSRLPLAGRACRVLCVLAFALPAARADLLRVGSDRPATAAVPQPAAGNAQAWSRPAGGGQLSHDGSQLVFVSAADNLVPGDHNGLPDIYLRDLASGVLRRVNGGVGGAQADGDSAAPVLSADGRRVAFHSFARNLVPADHNGVADVFVADARADALRRVSVASDGRPGNGHSAEAAISADGWRVAFTSAADNLVTGDGNQQTDVFVHDLRHGSTLLVSRAPHGGSGHGRSGSAALSADGRHVAFVSQAGDLLPGHDSRHAQVFVRDLQTGALELVSVAGDGRAGNRESGEPQLSADGRFVAFSSAAGNLIAGDSNGCSDVYVRDRWWQRSWRISVGRDGVQGQADSTQPALSADGARVVFVSAADLAGGGTAGAVQQVWWRSLARGEIHLLSRDGAGYAGDAASISPALSGDGRWASFESQSMGWVHGGLASGQGDVYVAPLGTH